MILFTFYVNWAVDSWQWIRGKDVALDITVISPLQKSLIKSAATHPGSALDTAYERKMRSHHAACQANNVLFIPLAIETLGGWHSESANTIKRIQKSVALSSQRDQSGAEKHIFEKLAVSLQRTQANMILSRQSIFPPCHIDGD